MIPDFDESTQLLCITRIAVDVDGVGAGDECGDVAGDVRGDVLELLRVVELHVHRVALTPTADVRVLLICHRCHRVQI